MAKEYVALSIQKNQSQAQPSSHLSKKAAGIGAGTGIGIGEVNKQRQGNEPPNRQQNFNQNKGANQKKFNPPSFSAVNPSAQDMKVSRRNYMRVAALMMANGHDENHSNGVNMHYDSEASLIMSSDNNRSSCATVLMISVIHLKYRTS
jgi:hypothetical protein